MAGRFPGLVFGLANARVRVIADENVLSELVSYLGAHLDVIVPTVLNSDEWVVVVRTDAPVPPDGDLDGRVILHDFGATRITGRVRRADGGALLMWPDEHRHLVVTDEAARRVEVTGHYEPGSLYSSRYSSLAATVHEAVRHLLRVEVERAGAIVVHGAAVAFGDDAVAFVGDKGAGKTTMLLTFLRRLGAAYVAGDRAFVLGEGNPPRVIGWPTALRINPPTLGTFDEFSPLLPRIASKAAKAIVLPQDLPALLGASICRSARLRAVVFLGPAGATPSAGVVACGADDALEMLERNQFTTLDREHPNWMELTLGDESERSAIRGRALRTLIRSVSLLRLPVCAWTDEALQRQASSIAAALAPHVPASGPSPSKAIRRRPPPEIAVTESPRGPLLLPLASAAVPASGQIG